MPQSNLPRLCAMQSSTLPSEVPEPVNQNESLSLDGEEWSLWPFRFFVCNVWNPAQYVIQVDTGLCLHDCLLFVADWPDVAKYGSTRMITSYWVFYDCVNNNFRRDIDTLL